MRPIAKILFIGQLLAVAYGVYNEIAPGTLPLVKLPSGMGLALALIGATMAVTLASVEKENADRAIERKANEVWAICSDRLAMVMPSHEREFYSLWPAQMATAQHNVDVTHLGPKPPQHRHGKEEKHYFQDLKRSVKSCAAQVRRVERLTTEKLVWIRGLVKDLEGIANFSLRAYLDPLPDEMPAALSVCRVDERYAWIVAIAEHESTTSFRDLMLTGASVQLVAKYFQERLWRRSIPIIDHGVATAGWETRIQAALDARPKLPTEGSTPTEKEA